MATTITDPINAVYATTTGNSIVMTNNAIYSVNAYGTTTGTITATGITNGTWTQNFVPPSEFWKLVDDEPLTELDPFDKAVQDAIRELSHG